MRGSHEAALRLGRHLWAASIALLAACAAMPTFAEAIVIESFDGGAWNEDGTVATQAGSHPWSVSGEVQFATSPHPITGVLMPDEAVRTVKVDLPPGLVGNPSATPQCRESEIQTGVLGTCPPGSQVGLVKIYGGSPSGGTDFVNSALYNMVPPPGVVAQFAFTAQSTITHFNASVRPGDHGVTLEAVDASQGLVVNGSAMTIWGLPTADAHDHQRCPNMAGNLEQCGGAGAGAQTTEAAVRPFVSLPTACTPPGVGLQTRIAANSWHDSEFAHASFFSHLALPDEAIQQGPDRCDRVPFEPSASVLPDSDRPDSPTGLVVELRVPQNDNPSGLDSSHVKRVEVTLPEGMSINPAAADGLAACADDELGVGNSEPLRCPAGSKIGTVEVDTPLLDERLTGAMYVRSQASSDPMSGDMFRIAAVIESRERGVRIKLPGHVRVDPNTGRIVTSFDNNPQMPFRSLKVRLKGGDRAPLALPRACGEHTVTTEMTPWARPHEPVVLTDLFTVKCEGGGFTPSFDAGSLSPTGGAFSPFVAWIERDDRQQYLSGVRIDLPPGLLAKLRGVELCRAAEADNGGCPAGARIGTAVAAAGAGSNPYRVGGDVFLTEGYEGAPYGLAVHVHAKAGPFDLGWVRVRQALRVDRLTAQASVASDPLPQIVKGVPVRLRSIDVDIDRPGFTINPTSCEEERVVASLTSVDGTVHRVDRRFQAADCQALPFRPRLGLRLTGRRQMRTGGHPGVRAVVRQTGVGEAGIAKARVTLPSSLALDPDNAQALCEFEAGTEPDLENHCPKGSIVGRARARTPLLGADLVGDVYFVKNVERHPETGNLIRKLPMIVVALRGQIAINLYGKSDTTKGGRLINTIGKVPDAPISQFNLNIRGGDTGILAVTRTRRARINLCASERRHFAGVDMKGHNGRRRDFRALVKTACAKRSTTARKRSATRR